MNSLHFPHPSWIEVDLKQLKENIGAIKKHTKASLLCLPVKANAYGHGLEQVGRAAEESGVDYLAVAHLQEGVLLRKSGLRIPILVLGAIHEDQILDFINFNLEFSISSAFKADLVAKQCKKIGQSTRVHIEVDTGMQRTGVRPLTATYLFQHLKQLGCFEIKGIYSHLATAESINDPFAPKQIEAFKILSQDPIFKNEQLIWHLANSGGTAFFPYSHLDMIRPALLTFGYPPLGAPESLSSLKPCFSLKTKISYFKVVEEGVGISYGHSFVTKKRTRIVTIPIGYGDGYKRALSGRGSVLIRGHRFPIVGKICMDQMMIDIGDKEAHVGDEVILIGEQGDLEISAQEIATLCDTNIYEILCSFTDRLTRIYR